MGIWDDFLISKSCPQYLCLIYLPHALNTAFHWQFLKFLCRWHRKEEISCFSEPLRVIVDWGHSIVTIWPKYFVFSQWSAVVLAAQSYLTVIPWTVAHHVLCPWDFLGKNTGVGCHLLLQGIFSTQGSNACLLCLLHCRRILYHWAIREAHDLPYLRLESPGLNLYKLSAVLVYDMWKIALALNDRKLESFKANDAFIRIAGVLLDEWETEI